MKYTIYIWLLLFSVVYIADIIAISMVYNFRIAQITKQPIQSDHKQHDHVIVVLLFDQFRKKYNGTFQNFAGGLSSFIYDFRPYYFRIDGAVSNIYEKQQDITTFSGTETDDILFTAGRNFILNERNVITLSALFGVPTHRIYRLEHVDFGYSQVGTGVQVDGLYELTKNSNFIYGGRYIYFVPRNARDALDNKYKFTLGNVGDILLAYKNNWQPQYGIEFGYTMRSRFGAHIRPHLDDVVKKTNYLRSNFYGVYKYKFSLDHTYNRLLFYGAYGFDHKPKIFGQKYIITFWTSWNISF